MPVDTRLHTGWQEDLTERLSALLRGCEGVSAMILTGSLARTELVVDEWSDVDVKAIVLGDTMDRYASSPDWLSPLGTVVGCQRIAHGSSTTLRVCFQHLRRLDLTLIPESAFAGGEDWEFNPFLHGYRVLWSDTPGLEEAISAIPPVHLDLTPDAAELRRIADQFWFTAALALSKAVRNDLLVALHLGLSLAQDCLQLQMILRDRALGTNTHREGGWGNDIVQRLYSNGRSCQPEETVEFIARACKLFDELAPNVCPGYGPRLGEVSGVIEKARASAGTGLPPSVDNQPDRDEPTETTQE